MVVVIGRRFRRFSFSAVVGGGAVYQRAETVA
jgi:hypothetical protein